MKVEFIEEPELQFGTGRHVDIRFGLMNFGSLDLESVVAPRRVRVGLVGTNETVEGLAGWIEKCRNGIVAMSCLSWKWRKRSSVKIAERTYEKERKHYTAEEKVAILRRHLLDRVPVSDLCEELGLRPTVFYRWQKEFFENGAAAFQAQERPHRQVEEKQKRIEFLEKKVQTKDEVLAELMAEHIALKKSLGEL